jgi:hypothetical protein
MKPIAQTFYINEPSNGVPGVYLTSIDLFFKAKSPIYGIEIQIRLTENGQPTPSMVPNSSVYKEAQYVQVSDDASVGTNFRFNCPILLQSATSYAIAVIPAGGNPDYEIWTAELGGQDVTTNSPIQTNNDTGTLFLSSNDIQFTAIQTEDIKFQLYIANFKSTTGTAVLTSRDSDYIMCKDLIGSFFLTEYAVLGNNSYDLARLTITSNTAAFTVGETVYQSNGSSNVATAVVYSANSSNIKLTNTVGYFVTSYQVKGVTSSANAVVSGVYANVITTAGSNTIIVPFTNAFTTGQTVYLGTNSRSYMQASNVSIITDGTHLQLYNNVAFSDSDAMFGRLRSDGNLVATVTSVDDVSNPNRITVNLDNVSSNITSNFANSKGTYLIGLTSGASANVVGPYNARYNAIVPQFADSQPGDTNINWSFTGAQFGSSKTIDSSAILLTNNVEKELRDTPRVLMSRSLEYNTLPPGRQGETTTRVFANMSTTNNMVSPFIDLGAKRKVTVTGYNIVPANTLYGYILTVESGQPFSIGQTIYQANSVSNSVYGQGTVFNISDTQATVSNVTGYFNKSNPIVLLGDNSVNANATDVTYYSEKNNTNLNFSSRYISKNVVLADGQDAEDLRVYITAYRPAGTDFLIYARLLNKEDSEDFRSKAWTNLVQISSPALLSSTVNTQDLVEIEYGLPASTRLFASNCSCNSTSNIINVVTNNNLIPGNHVYFADTTSSKFFVGRVQTVSSTNVHSVTLVDIPNFAITNAAFGIIPDLETPSGAFLYDANNNIVRYVSTKFLNVASADNIVYDSYKTFAIKIVPVADSTALIPIAKDMRAIALQI